MYRTVGSVGGVLEEPVPGGKCRRFGSHNCFRTEAIRDKARDYCARGIQPNVRYDWSCEDVSTWDEINSIRLSYFPMCEIKDLPVCSQGPQKLPGPPPVQPMPVRTADVVDLEVVPSEQSEVPVAVEEEGIDPLVVGLGILAVGGIGAAIYYANR